MVKFKSVRTRLIELLFNLKYNEYLSLPIIYHFFKATSIISKAHIRGILNRNTPKLFKRSQHGKGRYKLSAQGRCFYIYS